MLITQDELREGDEIIIPHNGKFKYLRVLRVPHPLFTKDEHGNKVPKMMRWDKSTQVWSTTKCSARVVKHTIKRSQYYTQRFNEWMCTSDDHNVVLNVNLGVKAIWLVKREML